MGTGELSGKPEEMLAVKTVDEAAYHPGESSNTPYHFMPLKPFPNILQLTSLRRRGNARGVSFGTLRWPIYIINSVGKPNYLALLIAELAKRSSIIIQKVVTHQAEKIWMYDRKTVRPHKVLLLTCVVNCTAGTPTPRLCPVVQWSMHWAPSRTTRVLVLVGARRSALETCGKKNASSAFKFGLIFILKVVLCFQGNFRLFQVNSSLPGDVAVDKFQFQN